MNFFVKKIIYATKVLYHLITKLCYYILVFLYARIL